jgi:hypothetical protein
MRALISEWPVFHITGRPPSRLRREDGPGQQREQPISPQDLAALVDHPQAVGVPVEGDAQVGALFAHGGDQIAEIVDDGGVGMMVGKARVGLAVEFDHVAPDRPQQRRRHQARDSVA